MALSVMMPAHEAMVKEEESDGFEYIQDRMTLAGLMAAENVVSLQSYPFVDAIKEESIDSAPAEAGGHPVKEEPIVSMREDSQQLADAVNPGLTMAHPDYGVTALLSLAAGQAPAVEQTALDLFRDPKIDQLDEEEKNVPLLEASANRRKTLNRSSSSLSDDEKIYISRDDAMFSARKRGRPLSARFSEEEVASDPKKRRQANNREAALRYREKKKMETWELKNEENNRLEKKKYLLERVDDISQEVHKWKRLCMKVFDFLPEYDFETPPSPYQERSPISFPRRSTSTCESIGNTSPAPDRAAQLQAAASRIRAKRKEDAARLRQEEEELTTRNAALRGEALQLYIEIVNLRKQLGFASAKTSADRDLPSLFRSSQFSTVQISDILSTLQS